MSKDQSHFTMTDPIYWSIINLTAFGTKSSEKDLNLAPTEVGMIQVLRFSIAALWTFALWIQSSPVVGHPTGDGKVEKLVLETKDGVKLGITYYPSSMGKGAVPIVMIHDFKESRAVFSPLAQQLSTPTEDEQYSHAVITVDLRGHGSSTIARDFNDRRGSYELDASSFKPQDFADMVLYDMEAVRKFLVTKNDEGALNLNKLCLMGSGMGANVALSWAAVDWSTPELPRIKQGQDVKMLLLASPVWNYKGLKLNVPIREPGVQRDVAMLVVYGKGNSRATKDARNILKNVEKFHPEPRRGEIPEVATWPIDTELQGTRLLVDPQFEMLPHFENFIRAHLSEKEFAWLPRRNRD